MSRILHGKITMVVLYKFDDNGESYYFETQKEAAIARFCVYCKYDRQRLTINRFVVPVSQVRKVLIPEEELCRYTITRVNIDEDAQSQCGELE